MTTVLVLCAVAAAMAIGLMAALVVAVKLLFWLVWLPFRLLFWALALPLLLIKFVLLAIGGMLGAAFFFIGGLIAAAALVAAILLPLVPLLLAAGIVWISVSATRSPRAAGV
jgi:hypothetical protein